MANVKIKDKDEVYSPFSVVYGLTDFTSISPLAGLITHKLSQLPGEHAVEQPFIGASY